jgi:hypothetical protein
VATMTIPIAAFFLPRSTPSRARLSLDTARIIKTGGNTTSYKSLPAENAAKSHAWKTLRDVSFGISNLRAKYKLKSCLLKTLTQIEGGGGGHMEAEKFNHVVDLSGPKSASPTREKDHYSNQLRSFPWPR